MARLKYKLFEDNKEIETKFGKIIVSIDNTICFPQGIIGFPSCHHYCFTEVPDNKLPGARILHSLEDEKLSFIVLPLAPLFYKGENGLIKFDDVASGLESYHINEENLSLVVIAKLIRIDGKLRFSINLKAPLFVDVHEKTAYQHIFIKNDYPISYILA